MNFDAGSLFASLVFGAIGLGAFLYGKKEGLFVPMIAGVLLMAYPYFVPSAFWSWIIGTVITAAMFFFKGY